MVKIKECILPLNSTKKPLRCCPREPPPPAGPRPPVQGPVSTGFKSDLKTLSNLNSQESRWVLQQSERNKVNFETGLPPWWIGAILTIDIPVQPINLMETKWNASGSIN